MDEKKSTDEQIPEKKVEADTENAESKHEEPQNVEPKVSDPIKDLQAQLDEKTDLYMRALASLDNLKKRVQKEREEMRITATSAIIEDLLPVIDHFELGLQAAEQSQSKDIVAGLKMVLDQFKNILKSYGLTELDPLHQEFNPHEHDCVKREFSENEAENVVLFVMRKGYKLHGRLIRPAAVVVSTKQQVEEQAGKHE